jgi:hypothetical protein
MKLQARQFYELLTSAGRQLVNALRAYRGEIEEFPLSAQQLVELSVMQELRSVAAQLAQLKYLASSSQVP